MLAALTVLAVGCKNKNAAPSAAQIKADSLAQVKAQLDSSINAKQLALKEAYAAGDDAAIAAATQELLDLEKLEAINDKAIAEAEAELAAEAEKDAENLAADAADDAAKTLSEDVPEVAQKAVEEAADAVAEEVDEAGNKVLPYQLVSTKPSFSGKDANSFSKWVGQNISYPAEAQEAGVEGTSLLGFRVNTDGSVSNVKVLKSSGNELLDNEAVRVVSSSPKWTSGQQNGENVPVSYVFPVVFKLQ